MALRTRRSPRSRITTSRALPAATRRRPSTWGERAAERALDCLAYEEAVGHYERTLQALDLLVPIDETAAVELLLALGDAHARAGDRKRARATFREAAAAARPLARPDLVARAALGFGGRSEYGLPRDDELLALLEEARTALGAGHPALRVRILARLVGTAPYSDSLALRDELSREAVAVARAIGDPDDVGRGARLTRVGAPRSRPRRASVSRSRPSSSRSRPRAVTATPPSSPTRCASTPTWPSATSRPPTPR